MIKPNTISTANHLSIASGAKSSRSISEVTVSGANVTTTTQGNQLMVDLSNVKSSVVLEVELSENSNDTWFSVDNSDTSESYYLSKRINQNTLWIFLIKSKQLKLLSLNLQKLLSR